MTSLQALALFTLVSPAILWCFFYVLFNVWADQTKAKSYSFIYMIVGSVGIVIDVYVNLWASVIFWDPPEIERMLLSARMDVILKEAKTKTRLQRYRLWLATQIVGRFLQPFDLTGQHTTYGRQP